MANMVGGTKTPGWSLAFSAVASYDFIIQEM